MNLSEVKSGDRIKVTSLPDPQVRAQAIRLGIYEGAEVRCSEKINKGPVILQNRLQEIAIGHNLATKIMVSVVSETSTVNSNRKASRLGYVGE